MPELPGLSKGELEVARVLWSLRKATVRQVYDAFPPERGIDFATVQTYLRRLDAKGYIQAVIRGRTCVYKPKVRPAQVIRQTVDDLVDRLFAGETLPLVRHLIEERQISDSDLSQLRQLIDRLEAEGGHASDK